MTDKPNLYRIKIGTFLVCLLCFSLHAMAIVPSTDGWYEVRTPQDLCDISTLVNKGQGNIRVRLMNDIDMSSVLNFTPIGLYTDTSGLPSHTFTGIFDGQQHIISNLTVSRDDTYEAGLFSRINGGGTLQNLGVVNATIHMEKNTRCGILAGEIHLSTVRNCFSAGNLRIEAVGQQGGIAGETYDTNVYDSYTTFPVFSSYGNWYNCYAVPDLAPTGELCYLLNGSSFLDAKWFQTLGEDDFPVWDSTHGLVFPDGQGGFSDIHDETSLMLFRDRVVEQELAYVDTVIAQKSLVDTYRSQISTLASTTERDRFLSKYTSLDTQRTNIQESERAYMVYLDEIEYINLFLQRNPNIDADALSSLFSYLQENKAPGIFPNGTYPYILEMRKLSATKIEKERTYARSLLAKAVSKGYGIGTEVTCLLQNADFSEGTAHWDGQLASSTGGIEHGMQAAAGGTGCHMFQTLTGLKDGYYLVEVHGAFIPAGVPESTNYAAFLYAGEAQNYLQAVCEDPIEASMAEDGVNCWLPESEQLTDAAGQPEYYAIHGPVSAAYAFREGQYPNSVLGHAIGGKLEIGIRVPGTGSSSDWVAFGNFRLTYCGPLAQCDEALDNVLQSQANRAETLLRYKALGGKDSRKYPNFSEALRESLRQTLNDLPRADYTYRKLSLMQAFSDLFQQIYDCKQAYRQMASAMESAYDAWLEEGDYTEESLWKMEELYARIWDGYDKGAFSAEEARELQKEIGSVANPFMKPVGNRALHSINFTHSGTATYTIQTLGDDPYVDMNPLSIDLTPDQTILTFEYLSPVAIPAGEFFYAEPLVGGREASYQPLPAVEEWTRVFVDISKPRKEFDWGRTGDWLRWDPVPNGNYTFQMRRMQIITPQEQQELIDGWKPIQPERQPTPRWFDLSGRALPPDAVKHLPHGIYIFGGRKVLK